MKCKECNNCKLGYIDSKPNDYICTFLDKIFVIKDIDNDCIVSEYKARVTREQYEKDLDELFKKIFYD